MQTRDAGREGPLFSVGNSQGVTTESEHLRLDQNERLRRALKDVLSYVKKLREHTGAPWHPTMDRALIVLAEPSPSPALDPATEIPCRFAEVGCQSPATAIYHVPKGCVCWPDPVQALCDQHQVTIESEGSATRIVALAKEPAE